MPRQRNPRLLLFQIALLRCNMFFIKMILNRSFEKISKFRGLRFENRLSVAFDIKSCRYSNSPEIRFLRNAEISSCLHSFPLYKKLIGFTINRMSMSQLPEKVCWNCKKPLVLKLFSCASCNALQEPSPDTDYFKLLGISQKFNIDLEDLKKRFMNLQKVFHPDKFVNRRKEELEISEVYSRLINKAYATIKNPVARAYYLLELQKIPTETPLEQEFLLDIMEKNELVETLECPKKLENFLKENNECIAKHLKLLDHSFTSNKMENARVNLSKLNYYNNLENKIKEKLQKLGLDSLIK